MADGYIEFTEELLLSPNGISELNRMIADIYDNLPGDTEAVKIFKGYGTPEGTITAEVGSMYQRLDGDLTTSLYVKTSGSGDTGWTATDLTSVIPLSRGGTGQDLSTLNQGDLYYDNGSNGFTRLTPGNSGEFLQTQGAAANPQWAALSGWVPLSVTSVSSATNSGDITIAASKQYKVTVDIVNVNASNDTDTCLRFNSDSGTNYRFYNITTDMSGAPGDNEVGDDSSNDIRLIQNNAIGDSGEDGYASLELYLNTYALEDTVKANVFFQGNNKDDTVFYFTRGSGVYTGTATTSFEIITTQTCDMDIRVYEMNQTT